MIGKMIAIRDAYGTALKELGEQNTKIVGLEADVASSTKSRVLGKTFPEWYFNVGINELGMVSMVADSTGEGVIPYMNIFAVFMTTRDADPIQGLIAYDNLNVKLCGTYCDLSDSYDGASHQAITDLAFVRATPSIVVITAADGAEIRKTVFAMTEHDRSVYLRPGRAEAPVYCSGDMNFQTDRGITAREGGGVTIITTGTILHKALEAADLLAQEGISTTVVGMHTIRPIDRDLMIQCTIQTGAIVTVEEHSIYGELGNTVAGVLVGNKPVPVKRIGAVDFAESRDCGKLLIEYGYSPQAITGKCRTVIKWK